MIAAYLPNAVIFENEMESETFSQSIVGVESIFFIYESIYLLKNDILSSTNKTHHPFIVQFFNQISEIILQLRTFVYEENSEKLIKMDPVNQQIISPSSQWKVTKFISTPSPYVERLIH